MPKHTHSFLIRPSGEYPELRLFLRQHILSSPHTITDTAHRSALNPTTLYNFLARYRNNTTSYPTLSKILGHLGYRTSISFTKRKGVGGQTTQIERPLP